MIDVWITDHQSHATVCNTMDIEWNGDFIWSEGNFSCDCNRSIFWSEVTDEPEQDECGDDRFSIVIIDPSTGKTLYDETE